MKEEWKKQLRQKMADYQQPAPEVSWEEIEEAVAASSHEPKRIAIWLRGIAAAVLVIVVSGVGYHLLNPQESGLSRQTASVVVRKKSPEIPIKKPVDDSQVQKGADHSLFISTKHHILKDDTVIVAQAEEVQMVEQAPEEQQTETQQPSSDKGRIHHSFSQDSSDGHLFPVRTHKKMRLMAKAYLGNGFSGNHILSDEIVTVYSSSLNDLQNEYQNNDVIQESANHRQPFRFGLSLRYVINDKWSIDGGLSYSLLTSVITQKTRGKQEEIKQRLNYIGIPINVNYQLWNYHRFSAYASAGGVVEKMVKGKRGDESVSIAPLQLSLNAGLGAEYEFVDWLSIYAEPGLAYYFDNGSKVQTFYQDKPLSFNLNLGLKLNIK